MCQAPKPLVEEFPQTLLNAEFYSAAMRSENDSDHDRLNAGRGPFLFKQYVMTPRFVASWIYLYNVGIEATSKTGISLYVVKSRMWLNPSVTIRMIKYFVIYEYIMGRLCTFYAISQMN